jgi:hypothetical protein
MSVYKVPCPHYRSNEFDIVFNYHKWYYVRKSLSNVECVYDLKVRASVYENLKDEETCYFINKIRKVKDKPLAKLVYGIKRIK